MSAYVTAVALKMLGLYVLLPLFVIGAVVRAGVKICRKNG